MVTRVGQARKFIKKVQAEIHKVYPRAYEKWEPEEKELLAQLVRAGATIENITETLQRQPSAVRSRIEKLNLDEPSKD